MDYKKVKNGKRITVKAWDNTITITDAKTGQVLGAQSFSDHVQAVTLAKAL